jgi:hypothetical protein
MNPRDRSSPISLAPSKQTTAGTKSGMEIELAFLTLELSRQFHGVSGIGSRRAHPPKRTPAIVRRLKFLLKALEVIHVCGWPTEKMVIGLIGECLTRLYPERKLPRIASSPNLPNQRMRTYL